jgi:superfamily I DNA/RNA helicase
MVNYKIKLGIDFDLSPKQIEIIERDQDTLVRALPGSGKTTILTLKIKNLLLDNPHINKICCISYTNVNVEDLEDSCSKILKPELLTKVEFLTFHSFCLQYVLQPFSYLYKSSKGLRPYKTIFNFQEHGQLLIDHLKKHNIEESEINKILESGKIYYNLKLVNGSWKPVSNAHEIPTIASYLNFLSTQKLIDFNLINLLSLFIIQENRIVRRALNRSIDWIFIDEFQDVSEIQCKIIEELSASRGEKKNEVKWFMVGDPNQSIYGFAGANPRSMYDMKAFFNKLHKNADCEIKLEKTHRCSNEVFNFARKNYNEVLNQIKRSGPIQNLNNQEIVGYLDDLEISDDLQGSGGDGKVIIKSTISSVSEIVNLKFNELLNEEVCCIGINRFNSIDVYKQYKLHDTTDSGNNFSLYSEIYKDYEDKYGFKYFSLFIKYLVLKYDFYNNRLKYPKALEKYVYSLQSLTFDKLNYEISNNALLRITVDSTDLSISLDVDKPIFDEFVSFSERLVSSLKSNLSLNQNQQSVFVSISESDKMDSLTGITEPKLEGFLQYITRSNTEKLTFEIKYIHKIKGLEYEQVIVQKIEDLPHKSNYGLHSAIFWGKTYQANIGEIYDYIQELNKLYVMITRPRKNLYIIKNQNKQYPFLKI